MNPLRPEPYTLNTYTPDPAAPSQALMFDASLEPSIPSPAEGGLGPRNREIDPELPTALDVPGLGLKSLGLRVEGLEV